MKTIKGLIFVTLLLALTLAINSQARAGVTVELPDVMVYEWMTGPDSGQYGINIDSPDFIDWYVMWFVIENPTANGSWTTRDDWGSEIVPQDEFNNFLTGNFGWPGPFASTNVAAYFNVDGLNIGPDEYDNRFFWTAEIPTSHFCAGLTLDPDDNSTESPDLMIFSGVATAPDQQPIPEPATLFLLGTGLAGIGAVRRKRAKKV